MTSRAGSKALIREINEALVLDVVRTRGTVSRAEISGTTGLSAATVTGITGKLVQAGLLSESESERGGVGRPARILELGRDAAIAAGVRLSNDDVDVVLVNPRGDVMMSHTEPLAETSPEAAAETIARAVDSAARKLGSPALRGIGVAVSGVVDQADGVVLHSGSLGWENVAFGSILSELTANTVLIDNYVNSFTMGLLLFDGRLAGRDLIVFSVGASLGASVVVQGKIHRGFSGAAGGFAHSRSALDTGVGRPCHCGDNGCLEAWSSRWGMGQELERRGVPSADLVADPAQPIIDDAAEHLGVAIANACKMFGPQHVVVAFSPDTHTPRLVSGCQRAFLRQYRFAIGDAPAIESIEAGGETFAKGAAYAMVAQLFTVDVAGTTAS